MDLCRLNNPIIIDIRNSYYYNIGHIDNAINIPYYDLLKNYSYYLDKDKIYYLYCDYGEQSGSIALRLSGFGYRVYSINGGYMEYKRVMGK